MPHNCSANLEVWIKATLLPKNKHLFYTSIPHSFSLILYIQKGSLNYLLIDEARTLSHTSLLAKLLNLRFSS